MDAARAVGQASSCRVRMYFKSLCRVPAPAAPSPDVGLRWVRVAAGCGPRRVRRDAGVAGGASSQQLPTNTRTVYQSNVTAQQNRTRAPCPARGEGDCCTPRRQERPRRAVCSGARRQTPGGCAAGAGRVRVGCYAVGSPRARECERVVALLGGSRGGGLAAGAAGGLQRGLDHGAAAFGGRVWRASRRQPVGRRRKDG